jgi:hypothetical protein
VPAVVDIVNRALIGLGVTPIVSLDQGGKAADSARALWPQVRDHVLRGHPWNCATARAVLAAEATAPAFEWAVQFPLPADWLRCVEVNGTRWPTDGWVVEGRKILTNETTCELLYVRREEDPNRYDAELVTALAAQLAHELAPALSALSSVVDRAEKKAIDALTEAKRTDGLEEELVENPLEGGWVSARFES